MAASPIMSTTFKEMAPAKIAEIKAEIQALEKSSSEVQRYKVLCEDLADWRRAMEPALPQPSGTSSPVPSAWPAEMIPTILSENGSPMTRKEIKTIALARRVRTPGSDPDSDLDRFISQARNYADLVERNGKILLPAWAVVEILKEQGKPMAIEALTDAILPEHTKTAKIRARYEQNFKRKVLQKAIADGVVFLERGKVALKK